MHVEELPMHEPLQNVDLFTTKEGYLYGYVFPLYLNDKLFLH